MGLSIRAKLILFPVVFLVFFLLMGGVSYNTISRVSLGGTVYQDIVDGKDLVADVLPPPCYLIESYLIVLRLIEDPSPARQKQLLADSARLKKEFFDRQEVWQKTLKKPELRTAMLEKAYDPAVAFFRLRDEAFLPALQGGDTQKARELALGPLTQLYEQQRQGVDLVVTLTNQWTAENQKSLEASLGLKNQAVAVGAVGILASLMLAAMAWRMGLSISHRLRGVTHTMDRLADGDLRMSA